MRRLCFVLFAYLFVTGVIAQEDEPLWTTHEDPLFTITAPAEWINLQDPSILEAGLEVITENNPDFAPMLDQAYTFIESGAFSLYLLDFQTSNNMSIAVTPQGFGSIDLQEVDQQISSHFESMGIEVIDTSTIDLPAGEALLLNARVKVNLGSAQEETVEQFQYIFTEGGQLYVVAFTSLEDEENPSLFQHIINTFEITGSESGWERITGDGVSFRLPEGWEADEEGNQAYVSPDANARLFINMTENSGFDLYVDNHLQGIEAVGQEIHAQETLNLPSGQFVRIHSADEQYDYLTEVSGRIYTLSFFAEDFEEYAPLFEQMVDTFIFKDSTVGRDVEAVLEELSDIEGDAERGERLYTNQENAYGGRLGCAGCHLDGGIAPSTEGKWERASTVRLDEPEFEGYTPEQYLVESILQPMAYIVPNYAPIMPQNFGERLTTEDLADLVAYLKTTVK